MERIKSGTSGLQEHRQAVARKPGELWVASQLVKKARSVQKKKQRGGKRKAGTAARNTSDAGDFGLMLRLSHMMR